jgi:hypothetical protein
MEKQVSQVEMVWEVREGHSLRKSSYLQQTWKEIPLSSEKANPGETEAKAVRDKWVVREVKELMGAPAGRMEFSEEIMQLEKAVQVVSTVGAVKGATAEREEVRYP